MKKRHRKYSKISLEYFQACYVVNEEWKHIYTIFNEKYQLLENDCGLRLRLKLDNKTIWSCCNIDTLLEMYLNSGKYYPFTCDDCGIPECAGIFSPCRIIHHGEDIVLCLRSPLQESRSKYWRYRAYRLRKKEFLRELLCVVHFRISLENMLKMDEKYQTTTLLMKIFGSFDALEYQYKISQKIRKVYPKLKNALVKMMGVETQ